MLAFIWYSRELFELGSKIHDWIQARPVVIKDFKIVWYSNTIFPNYHLNISFLRIFFVSFLIHFEFFLTQYLQYLFYQCKGTFIREDNIFYKQMMSIISQNDRPRTELSYRNATFLILNFLLFLGLSTLRDHQQYQFIKSCSQFCLLLTEFSDISDTKQSNYLLLSSYTVTVCYYQNFDSLRNQKNIRISE